MRIMAAALNRVRNPGEAAVKVARNLDVHAGSLVLAGIQLRMSPPRPARKQCAVHKVLVLTVKILGSGDTGRQDVGNKWRQSRYRSADGGLGDAERLGQLRLNAIGPQARQRHDHRLAQPGNGWPETQSFFRCLLVNQGAQVGDLLGVQPRSMIHVRRPVSSSSCVVTRFSYETGRRSSQHADISRFSCLNRPQYNKEVNRLRAVIERVISDFKNWAIMHTDYRRPLRTFGKTISAVIALHFYQLAE